MAPVPGNAADDEAGACGGAAAAGASSAPMRRELLSERLSPLPAEVDDDVDEVPAEVLRDEARRGRL